MEVRRKATAARGGHQWSVVVEEELGGGLDGILRERERPEIMFFMLKNVFIICRSRLASLSR